MKKLFKPLSIVLLSLILTPTEIFSADSLPNFTEVVEKNIPSVVIVNAKKNIGQNNNPRLNIPNVPDEFQPFLDKFFNGMPTPPPGNQSRKTPSFGSGFILSADGYIMTNNHVISNADEITIRLSDDTVLDAKLIGQDERSDLALLKVEANNLPMVSIGDSNNLKLGEWVLAIGSPFGFDHTVTAGIVSGKKRNLPNESYVPYIQTDVAINPGNSGGPLFNLQGEVVGVNAQIYTRSGGFMGVSFAIPSETLSNVYKQLKDDGKVKRGWLGVFIQQVDKDLAESFGLDKAKGAVVARILENSPAEKAGLKQGDIILKFDNKEIRKSKDLPLMVGSTNVNTTVKIELLRDKRVITKFIRIEELPDDNMIASMKENTIDKTIVSGLTVSDINESMKKNLNIYGGVKVDKISADQLNNSKIKVNDIITHINNKPIYNTNDFKKEISGLSKNTLANLLVYRDNTPLFLAIKISK
jgi:serine protease Do